MAVLRSGLAEESDVVEKASGRSSKSCANRALVGSVPLIEAGVMCDNQQSRRGVECRSSLAKERSDGDKVDAVLQMRFRASCQVAHGELSMPAASSLERRRLTDVGSRKNGSGTVSASVVKTIACMNR